MHAHQQQFLNDLRASWQKTALLGVLFVVGLVFWIPPLVRGLSKPRPTAAATSSATALPNGGTVSSEAGAGPGADAERFTWEQGEQTLLSDPLVRSVDASAVLADPFQVDLDQFPPPVLFEDRHDEPAKAAVETPVRVSKAPDKLVLRSTVVGVRRRAALINGRLYPEGSVLKVDGQKYTVEQVQPRRVVLRRGDESIELVLPSALGGQDDDATEQATSETDETESSASR